MKVELLGHYGSDLMVANCARTSFDRQHEAFTEGDARLIRFLAREGHWTPFAHPHLTFRITAPVFVARQMVKHQVGLVWSEVSRRYVKDDPEFCGMAWRAAAPDVKQGSGGPVDDALAGMADRLMDQAINTAEAAYGALLELGIAPEQARVVLPLATFTTWIWTGSLHAFARVCRERLHPTAQEETRVVAECISDLIAPLFPHSWAALVPQEAA